VDEDALRIPRVWIGDVSLTLYPHAVLRLTRRPPGSWTPNLNVLCLHFPSSCHVRVRIWMITAGGADPFSMVRAYMRATLSAMTRTGRTS
jgi:hypothetical protein